MDICVLPTVPTYEGFIGRALCHLQAGSFGVIVFNVCISLKSWEITHFGAVIKAGLSLHHLAARIRDK